MPWTKDSRSTAARLLQGPLTTIGAGTGAGAGSSETGGAARGGSGVAARGGGASCAAAGNAAESSSGRRKRLGIGNPVACGGPTSARRAHLRHTQHHLLRAAEAGGKALRKRRKQQGNRSGSSPDRSVPAIRRRWSPPAQRVGTSLAWAG